MKVFLVVRYDDEDGCPDVETARLTLEEAEAYVHDQPPGDVWGITEIDMPLAASGPVYEHTPSGAVTKHEAATR